MWAFFTNRQLFLANLVIPTIYFGQFPKTKAMRIKANPSKACCVALSKQRAICSKCRALSN
jgi:hypothetical protein